MQNRLVIKALTVVAVGAFFYVAFFRPPAAPQVYMLDGSTMGTTWQVQIVAHDQQSAVAAGAELKGLLAHLDREVFSTWTADSELSRLNRSPPESPVPVSSELLHALLLAQEIHVKSRNTFDITIGPLVNLWGFGPAAANGTPDDAAVAAAMAQLGAGKFRIDAAASTVTFTASLTLDLSSIAEGYAADAVAGLLQERGLTSFLVDVGGELRLQGVHPDGKPWTLAIERPQDGAREPYAGIDSQGEALAVSTSGDYRNVREVEGKRFSHILDPRSGRPVAHELASVTVIGETAAEADAWSTALMVLGPAEGRAVADSEGLAAYFIMRGSDGLTHAYTTAFARFLQQAEPSLQHKE